MAFNDIYRGRRVLVTGHTGFKGSWLALWLKTLGAQVCGFSIDVPTSPSLFGQAQLGDTIDDRRGDIRDTGAFAALIQAWRPEFVFHLAAQAIVSTAYADPLETISTNVLGTASVLEALRGVDWRCAGVIVASDKCYENVEQLWGYREIDALGGKDVYSASKGAAEVIFHAYARSFFGPGASVRLASARAGNVIGGGDWARDRIVADCVRAWAAGEPVRLRRPESVRPWQHVLEPLGGYLALGAALYGDDPPAGESFNFGPLPDRPRPVLELLTGLAAQWTEGRADGPARYEILERPPFAEAGLLLLNCEKARQRLDWEATLHFDEMVALTGGWYRAVHGDPACAPALTVRQIEDYTIRACARGRSWSR